MRKHRDHGGAARKALEDVTAAALPRQARPTQCVRDSATYRRTRPPPPLRRASPRLVISQARPRAMERRLRRRDRGRRRRGRAAQEGCCPPGGGARAGMAQRSLAAPVAGPSTCGRSSSARSPWEADWSWAGAAASRCPSASRRPSRGARRGRAALG